MARVRVHFALAAVLCAALLVVAGAAEAPKPRRDIKDWQKLNSDAAYRDLEDAWMDDEVEDPDDQPTKWTKDADGKRHPPMPRGPKMEMGFATLTPGTTKEQCEKIAVAWSQLLSTGAVQVKAYSIEDDKILLGVDGGYTDMFAVKDFVLDQPECVEFEWQQQKFKPKPKGADKNKNQKSGQSAEDKAAAARIAKEAELRRKVESGELLIDAKGKGKGKGKAAPAKAKAKAKPADAKAKAKAKVKAKDAKKAAPTTKPKADAKPKAGKDEL